MVLAMCGLARKLSPERTQVTASSITMQNWRADLESSAKLSTYSEFKSLLNPEKHVKVVGNYLIRKHLAKLRTSNHA